jgi:hypothetical protein
MIYSYNQIGGVLIFAGFTVQIGGLPLFCFGCGINKKQTGLHGHMQYKHDSLIRFIALKWCNVYPLVI